MAIKRFWQDMAVRVGLKRTDKIMVGNVDNNDAEHVDLANLLDPLNTDDLAESTTKLYLTPAERTAIAGIDNSKFCGRLDYDPQYIFTEPTNKGAGSYFYKRIVSTGKIELWTWNDVANTWEKQVNDYDFQADKTTQDGLISTNSNNISKKTNILTKGDEAYAHASRVYDDGGTTIDLEAIRNYIKFHRQAKLALMANSRKIGKLYAVIGGANGDATFTSSAVHEIDKYGNSVAVSANMPRRDYQGKYVAPADNSYYNFDGTQTEPKLADAAWNDLSGNLILYAKFNTTTNTYGYLIGKYQVDVNIYGAELFVNSNGNIRCAIYDGLGGTNDYSPIHQVNDGNDHFIVARISNGDISIFDNGVLVGTQTSSIVNANYNKTLDISARQGTSIKLVGKLYKTGLFNLALTDQECIDISNGLPIPDKYVGANNVELLLNNDFEWGFTSGLANNWFNFSPTDLTPSQETTIFHKGFNSQRVVSTSSNYIWQTVNLTIGKEYKITGWCYVVSGTAAVVSHNGQFGQINITTTGSWQKFETTFTATQNLTTLRLYNLASVSDVIWDDITFKQVGNTLNLDGGKTNSTWYDKQHPLSGAVTGAPLQNPNNFTKEIHPINAEPVIPFSGSVKNYFLNSGTPATQIVTGLTIGNTYRVEGRNKGLALIEETGGNGRGGIMTEVDPFIYEATQTSVTITLVAGHAFDWVQLVDGALPQPHIPTGTSSVTKVADVATSTISSLITDSFSLYFEAEFENQRTSATNFLEIRDAAGANYFGLKGDVAGKLVFDNNNASVFTQFTPFSFTTGTNKCLMQWDSSTNKFTSFINGVKIDDVTITGFTWSPVSLVHDGTGYVHRIKVDDLSTSIMSDADAITKTT